MPEKDLPQQQRYAQSLRCLQKSNYSLTYLCVPVVPPADVEPGEPGSSSSDEDELEMQQQMNNVFDEMQQNKSKNVSEMPQQINKVG